MYKISHQNYQFLFLFFLLGLSTSLNAQKRGYKYGYIINHKGDTVSGWVQDRSQSVFEDIYDRIRFVEEGHRRKKKYDANQILGYGYGSVDFESVGLTNQTNMLVTQYYVDSTYPHVFLRVMERSPKLIHYEQEFMFDDNDFIDSYPLFYKPNSRQMVRVTQGILGLKKKRLAEYFRDCPSLIQSINSGEIISTEGVFQHYIDHCDE